MLLIRTRSGAPVSEPVTMETLVRGHPSSARAGHLRRDLARSLRRAARRRDRAPADLCPRHPAGRPVGPRPAAQHAGDRRARCGRRAHRPIRAGRAGACSAVAAFGLATIVFGLSSDVTSRRRALSAGRRRHDQRLCPPDPGPDRDARSDARPGLGGELGVRRASRRTRRVRSGASGGRRGPSGRWSSAASARRSWPSPRRACSPNCGTATG